MVDDLDDDTISEAVEPASLHQGDQLSLMVLRGPDAGRWVRVPPQGALIGRRPGATVRVTDPAVSRSHALIEPEVEGGYRIRDLGSRNGVFLDGRRVAVDPLLDGVQIQLSSETLLRARYSGSTETELLDELQRAATTDAVTGVANRHYLMSRLEQELSFARRHGVATSIVLVDLDGFKAINDRYGHAAGDQILGAVARTLQEATRLEDVLARYGGDEFVIISRGYGPEETVQFGERLCEAVRRAAFGTIDTPALRLTLSVGVAGRGAGQDGADAEVSRSELLGRADAALYEAKHAGRDRVCCWTGPPTSPELAPDHKRWARSTMTGVPAFKATGRDENEQ